jgi:hypothetical protein
MDLNRELMRNRQKITGNRKKAGDRRYALWLIR